MCYHLNSLAKICNKAAGKMFSLEEHPESFKDTTDLPAALDKQRWIMRKLPIFLLTFLLISGLGAQESETGLSSEDLFRDEEISVSEPSTKIQNTISKFEATVNQKRAETSKARSEIKSAPSYMEDIEYLKESLKELQSKSDGLSPSKYESEMESEISDRMTRQARIAELDGDGLTLNENGRKSVENDIEAIRKKYEDLYNDEMSAELEKSGPKSESLKVKIREFLGILESGKFNASSMACEGLSITFSRFSGKKGSEGWPYTISFEIGGKKVLEKNGHLLYTEISGKSVPSPAKIGDSDYEKKSGEYNSYLDAVDIFDALLTSGSSFVEAVLEYTVKPSADAMEYTFKAQSIKLNNVLTGKNIKTLKEDSSFVYRPQPEINVDLGKTEEKSPAPIADKPEKTVTEPYADISDYIPSYMEDSDLFTPPSSEIKEDVAKIEPETVIEPKEEPEKKPSVRITIQAGTKEKETPSKPSEPAGPSIRTKNPDSEREKKNSESRAKKSEATKKTAAKLDEGKSTYSSVLFFLPGTYNFYSSSSDVTMTAGYEFDFAILDHLYAGLKLESAIFKIDTTNTQPYDGYNSPISIVTDFDALVLTGVLGMNYNLTDRLRLDLFAEGGYVLGDFNAGAGIGLEFMNPSTKSGLFLGYTGLFGVSDAYQSKFTLGFQQSF